MKKDWGKKLKWKGYGLARLVALRANRVSPSCGPTGQSS